MRDANSKASWCLHRTNKKKNYFFQKSEGEENTKNKKKKEIKKKEKKKKKRLAKKNMNYESAKGGREGYTLFWEGGKSHLESISH